MQIKNIFAFGILAIVALILLPNSAVHGRYLPTRSNVDQARRAQVKEILRLLLDAPSEEETERHRLLDAEKFADMYELRPLRASIDDTKDAAPAHRSKRDVSSLLSGKL